MWQCLLNSFTNCLKNLPSSSTSLTSSPNDRYIPSSDSTLKYSSFGTDNSVKEKYRQFSEIECDKTEYYNATINANNTINSRMLNSASVVSAHNFSLKLPDFQVLPKITRDKSDDWILKYSDKFDPCSLDRNRGVNKFELVPWRQNKKRVDIVNETAWEPIAKNFELLKHNEKNNKSVIKCLHKLQTRRTKRYLKKRVQYEKRVKRHIRIRLMFTIELRHKRMEFFVPKIETRKFERVDFALSQSAQTHHQLAIEDVSASDCTGMGKHVGYFSNRSTEGITFRWQEQYGLSGFDDFNPFKQKIVSETMLLCNRCVRSVFIILVN